MPEILSLGKLRQENHKFQASVGYSKRLSQKKNGLEHQLTFQKKPAFDSIPSSSQPFVTPAPGDLMPFSGLHENQACIWYTDIHVHKTQIHINVSKRCLEDDSVEVFISLQSWVPSPGMIAPLSSQTLEFRPLSQIWHHTQSCSLASIHACTHSQHAHKLVNLDRPRIPELRS